MSPSSRRWGYRWPTAVMILLASSITTALNGAASREGAAARTLANPKAARTYPQARVLHFPTDRSLGQVRVQDADADLGVEFFHDHVREARWQSVGPARGDVAIPAGKRAHLEVFGERAFRDLSPLSRLRADDIYRLSLVPWKTRGVDADRSILPRLRGLTGLKILELGYVDALPKHLSLLKHLGELQHVSLWTREAAQERPPTGPALEDSCLESLVALRSLTSLDLCSNGITDAGLVHLGRLRSLRELSLFSFRLRGPGLEQLARLPDLCYLKLFTPEMTGGSLRYLKGCGSLRKLQLRGLRRITDADLEHLKHLSTLEDLDLDTVPITDGGLVHLKTLQSLKSLSIAKNPNNPGRIRDDGMAHLKSIPSLEHININNNDLTDKGLAHLAQLPNLRALLLSTVRYVDSGMDKYCYTDRGLEALSRLHKLEELSICSPVIGDAGMAHIAKLTNLKTLHVAGGQVTNAGVAKLASLKSLERLTLETPKVTVSGLNHLNALTNLKKLNLMDIRQDNGGLELSQLINLEELSVSLRHYREGKALRHDKLRDEDMAWVANLQKLRSLQGVNGISDAGLKHMARLTEVECLGVGGAKISDDGLAYLANMKKLNLLTLSGDITDKGLRHIEGLKRLTFLDITSEGAFSKAALHHLRSKLPNLQILRVVP